MSKVVQPQLGLESFSCPYSHCGALAHQTWFKLFVVRHDRDSKPWVPLPGMVDQLRSELKSDTGGVIYFYERMLAKDIFFEDRGENFYSKTEFINVHASKCYSCGDVAIWRSDALIYPTLKYSVEPSADMPADVRLDFLEANTIVDLSPRGAAALLRLSVQKLMPHIGGKGKNLNTDIGELVQKGLDPRIQKALDVVRVVGNEAVHPGQIDLRDDKATAVKLFGLVNLIVDDRITRPKHVEELYDSVVPEGAKQQIEKRDEVKLIADQTGDPVPKASGTS